MKVYQYKIIEKKWRHCCETENINKNPKYRIIKYKDEFDDWLVRGTWLALFFPMINWLIQKVRQIEKDFTTI